jgi:DNA invertase Pin-like site-specific DNA recombinase
LFNMCAAFAEMERELIRERVNAGLEIAHKMGRRGGRPKAMTLEKLETLKALRESGGFSVRQMCVMAKVSRSGYYRAVGGIEAP